MSGPSTSNERATGQGIPQHQHQHQHLQHLQHHQQPMDHTAAAAMALANSHDFSNPAAVMGHHDDDQFHRGVHLSAAAAAQMQQQQMQQQQLQQHHLQQQHLQQQMQHHPLQQHHHLQQLQQQQLHHQQIPQHAHSMGPIPTASIDYENGGYLVSRHGDGDIIKTFSSKLDLVKYVKTVLNEEEQCKIVINSSKPKAVYFQCERSGSFRTTVKDAAKRQRVAYTKRSKCGYRLVANLYPPEKDKAKKVKKDPNEFDGGFDDDKKDSEMWILRMIQPAHNHPPEPNFAVVGGKKKRAKYTRTLVEKPMHRNGNPAVAAAAAVGYQPELLDHHHLQPQLYLHLQHNPQQQLHHPHLQHAPHLQHHDDGSHPSVQDVAAIAAMEAAPGSGLLNPPVDPSIDPSVDPNVDPSVQQHDHAHGHVH